MGDRDQPRLLEHLAAPLTGAQQHVKNFHRVAKPVPGCQFVAPLALMNTVRDSSEATEGSPETLLIASVDLQLAQHIRKVFTECLRDGPVIPIRLPLYFSQTRKK